MKVEDCLIEVNRKKISIWYNECYSKGRDQSLSKYLFTASVLLVTWSFS